MFDLVTAAAGLIFCGWIILLAFALATLMFRTNGFYTQMRIGKDGAPFRVIKIRTMRTDETIRTNVTTVADPRLTEFGKFIRRWKIDELPQLLNVLLGQMSFVGPRPDVPGYADRLTGDDRIILSVRPGITGPATLKYRSEEVLLAAVTDPEQYNREIVWPDKVRINKQYILEYSFRKDLQYITETMFQSSASRIDAHSTGLCT